LTRNLFASYSFLKIKTKPWKKMQVISKIKLPNTQADLLKKVLSRHGQIATIRGKKNLRVQKKHSGSHLVKYSTFQLRLGIVYDNQTAVKDQRETGELPSENAGLAKVWELVNDAGGKRIPALLRNSKTGRMAIAGATVHGTKSIKSSEFVLNGESATKEDLKGIAYSSDIKPSSGEKRLWTMYYLDNILSIS